MTNLAVLKRLEQSLRDVGAQSREIVKTDGFMVFLDLASSAYLLSYAVPSAREPADWSQAIAAMREAFESRGRRPRLEYFHELHPGLAWALEEAGFAQDMSVPVMTLAPEDLAKPTSAEGSYVRLTADDADRLEPFLRGQNLAYGGDGGEDALVWLPNLLEGLKAGRSWVAGLEQADEFVSGAIIQGAEVGELAGVWTLPDEQKQGLAFRVCQRLLSDYFAEGHECWLSAAEGALSLYEHLGFERVGTQLNYGWPEGV